MKKCIIYGNCQADALKVYLSKIDWFKSNYSIVDLKPIHLLTKDDLPSLTKEIKEIDLFIYQKIAKNYKNIPSLSTVFLLPLLKNSCKKISFPSVYFKGFNPEMAGLKNQQKKLINKPYEYFDKNILKFCLDDLSEEEIIGKIKDHNFYSKEQVLANYNLALSALKSREEDLSISISHFIDKHKNETKLFHVFNHPSASILTYISNQILTKINSENIIRVKHSPDVLSRNSYPIYQSVANHLGLNFSILDKYKIANENISISEFIESHKTFVASNRQLVLHNVSNEFNY